MIPDIYLRYLALKEFINDNICIAGLNMYAPDIYKGWYTNHEEIIINLKALKEEITRLEKMIFSDFICTDSDSKE